MYSKKKLTSVRQQESSMSSLVTMAGRSYLKEVKITRNRARIFYLKFTQIFKWDVVNITKTYKTRVSNSHPL